MRPKISEKVEKSGRNAVAAAKKAIPSQNVSMAEPWRVNAIICNFQHLVVRN